MINVSVKNINKIYGKDENKIIAINDISFELEEGQFVVILGPSGSGKSTLLNILGGMDGVSSGNVYIMDKNISDLSSKELTEYRRNDIGFVFQFYNLMSNLTALENVRLAQTEMGMNSLEALNLVGLSNRKNNFPSQLSGGEQQRVSIARAIVKNPKLLLCDEPTGALDSKTGKNIISLLLNLAKEKNQTVVIVTHNSKLALVANRVIRLSDGQIVDDTIQEHPQGIEEIEW